MKTIKRILYVAVIFNLVTNLSATLRPSEEDIDRANIRTIIGLNIRNDDSLSRDKADHGCGYAGVRVLIQVVKKGAVSPRNTLWLGEINFRSQGRSGFAETGSAFHGSVASSVLFRYAFCRSAALANIPEHREASLPSSLGTPLREVTERFEPLIMERVAGVTVPELEEKFRRIFRVNAIDQVTGDDGKINIELAKLAHISGLMKERFVEHHRIGYTSVREVLDCLQSLRWDGSHFPRYRLNGRGHFLSDDLFRNGIGKIFDRRSTPVDNCVTFAWKVLQKLSVIGEDEVLRGSWKATERHHLIPQLFSLRNKYHLRFNANIALRSALKQFPYYLRKRGQRDRAESGRAKWYTEVLPNDNGEFPRWQYKQLYPGQGE